MIAMISKFRSPAILKPAPKPVPLPSLNCYKPIFYAGARVYVWGGDLCASSEAATQVKAGCLLVRSFGSSVVGVWVWFRVGVLSSFLDSFFVSGSIW